MPVFFVRLCVAHSSPPGSLCRAFSCDISGNGCRFRALFFMRQRLPLSFRFPAEVAANGHNSAPSDSSLPRRVDLELPPARPAWRTPRLVNSHKKAVAAYLPASAPPAVGTTSGRRRCRVEAADGVLGIGCASLRPCGLRYKEGVVCSRATHYFFCIHLYSSLPPPQNAAARRGLRAAGCLRL